MRLICDSAWSSALAMSWPQSKLSQISRAAAAGGRADAAQSRNGAKRFFRRLGDLDFHLLGRPFASLDVDPNAGEIDVRKQRNRQIPCAQQAADYQYQQQKQNRTGVTMRPPCDLQGAAPSIFTAMPSSNS